MAVRDELHGATLGPARGRLERIEIAEFQRNRMLAAVIEAVREVGYAGLTVAQVTVRARVSRKTFYDLFENREDCFLAAFEQILFQARPVISAAYGDAPNWREGIRTALAKILELIEQEPALAKLCIGETLGASEIVNRRRTEVQRELADVIDRGRLQTVASRPLPPMTAEGIVGGIAEIIRTRMLMPRKGQPPVTDLLGPLMSMIVLPYLGAKAASYELNRPASRTPRERPARKSAPSGDPFHALNMRLTYRTVRVLTVIAEHPGASNREVAEGSGIIDQGQISKLLTRLAGLDLIENRGAGQVMGVANAWWLTPRGTQLRRAAQTCP
jgi:AcrR family transcriptional regulator/DNA-binding MarR family transcriptional regulator